MKDYKLSPRESLNKAFVKAKPDRENFEAFETNLSRLLEQINHGESEEFHKNLVSDFLKNTYYSSNYFINTKGRNDLVIHNGKNAKSSVGVILEVKSPTNKGEMLKVENLNTKAFQELVLYFLRERITGRNLEIRYLVVTNIYEWFIFDAKIFEDQFAQNKALVRQFTDFEEKKLSGDRTEFFYKDIAKPAIASVIDEIKFTHFDIRDYQEALNNREQEDRELIDLFKMFSPQHLLKLDFANDSNSLNKPFYNELLYIIGLTETKEGGKKLIGRKKDGDRNIGSLLENAINRLVGLDRIPQLKNLTNPEEFGETHEEKLFNVALRLAINWINRVLFLKLLEAQLIKYHQGDRNFAFLNLAKVKDYKGLDSLFFEVLAREQSGREEDVREIFANVPYLNSSLFEQTEIEQNTITIGALKGKSLPIFSASVLKDHDGKRRSGDLDALAYLFEFLDAYDFSSDELVDGQEDSEKLINAAVLGLIFEKINGYKDGSFFTPSFITMYMCRETIRRAIAQKFNEVKGWNCENLDQLHDKISDKKEANAIINSLRICDPAVGSGHFLVSALNEIIAIKSELRVLLDRQGKSLKDYRVEVRNDKLIVYDDEGKTFDYRPKNAEKQRVQEALFHEKQTIIENCLFGVDINPNSVTICCLRLWIELLKNAYYKANNELETLPNIDINIKVGNSLISRFALDSDLSIALRKNKSNIVTYRDAVQTYRNAENREQKRKMEQLIASIKSNFRTTLFSNDLRKINLRQLEARLYTLENQMLLFEQTNQEKQEHEKEINKLINEIEQFKIEIADLESGRLYKDAFEWRFEFPEVLSDDGDFIGFDVVIGNPPYISIQDLIRNDKNLANYYRQNFQSAAYGNFDIYILFIEMINVLTNKYSTSSFILPSKFLTTDYGKVIRQYLLENKLIDEIVDFEDHQVFDVATTYTCMIFVDKTAKSSLRFFKIKPSEILIREHTKGQILYADIFDKTWILDNSDRADLVQKIRNDSLPLKDLSCEISRGSSTGDDKIFVLTKLDNQFVNGYGDSIELEIELLIKPIFATNFSRYLFKEDPNTYVIFPYVLKNKNYRLIEEQLLAEQYPKTYQYLLSNKQKLQNRRQIKQWYGYSAARSLKNHDDSDILIPLLADRGIFTLSPKSDKYTLMAGGGFSILISDKLVSPKFLLSLLNSKLLFFVLRRESNKFRGGYITCTKQYFENLPIKLITPILQKPLIKLVDKILAAKRSDPKADTSALETECDRLVYQLYGLTEAEIKIVEGVNDGK